MAAKLLTWARKPAAIAIAALATLGLGAAAASQSGVGSGVLKVRTGGDGDTTRVVMELDRATTSRLIADGDDGERRVVMAFPRVDVASDLTGAGQGLVKSWQVDSAGGSARLRLNLTRDAKVAKRFLLPPAAGVPIYRYVVDLKREGASATAAVAPSIKPVKAVPERPPAKPVIVVDAGHGGKDPGALGKSNHEADVTLAAALALKARLERTGRYRVVMTRKSDVYVPLESRVQIARAAQADLFISLHADAGANAETRGASVYTLSEKGSERIARRVMTEGSFIDMRLPGVDRSVNQILLDLTQRSTRNRSAIFAETLLTKLDGRVSKLRRSHRDAGYVVLLAPDVPAVLLEMGFMTNAEDEALLADAAKRRRLMDGVAEAIDAWFAGSGGGSIGESVVAAR